MAKISADGTPLLTGSRIVVVGEGEEMIISWIVVGWKMMVMVCLTPFLLVRLAKNLVLRLYACSCSFGSQP